MKKLMFLLALSACFVACGNDDDYDDDYDDEYREPVVISEAPKISTIAFADVTDAVALYITAPASQEEGDVSTRAASETISNSLFKITGSGESVKVQFASEEQENVDQPQVFFIKDLSEKYIYMSYNNVVRYDTIAEIYGWNDTIGEYVTYEFRACWEHTQVIVKKDDGAVFKIESRSTGGNYAYESYKQEDLIKEDTELQVDYNGNVYVLYTSPYPYKIMKIYTHGKEVYLTQINRDNMGVDDDWLVDQQGNVLINTDYTRLATGEFTRSPEQPESTSHGDKIFTVYGDSEGFYRLNSEQLERYDDNGWASDTIQYWIQYCQAEAPAMSWKNLKLYDEYRGYGYLGSYRVFSYKDKTIVVVGYHKLTIYDRDKIEITELDEYISFGDYKYYGNTHPCTEKYVYKFTDQQIWRAEIETGKAELLYDYGKEYVIKSIKVKDNIVTCNAFELRRGNDVVLEIYEDKTTHLVESVNNDKIIYLERLN